MVIGVYGKALTAFAFLFCATQSAWAISDRVIHDAYSGLAISGYDPVAYFTDRKAMPGRSNFELVLDGSYWHFVNEGNMAAFKASPDIYSPAFGGYGAGSVAMGRLTPGDPQIWAIYKDRLYFFFSEDERNQWMANPDGFILQANVRWKELYKTLSAD